jgi:hypothetical protein
LCSMSVSARRTMCSRFPKQRFLLSDHNSFKKEDNTSRAIAFSTFIGRSTTIPLGTK